MATLTVWKFPTADGAGRAEERLEGLMKQELVTVHDAATGSWPEGRRSPKTREMNSLVGAGALGGAFWGLLFGLIFFVPLLGAAVGAAFGALGGSMADAGIDEDFIKSVRAEVEPGTSALFVMTSDAVLDRVKDAFKDMPMTLIRTNLSHDQEAALRTAFADA
ncbi:DUF1269 domain-containing protein [Pseudonocardia nematodicida]|uniref:DUF1269 domain-containing protein n=1 Tax=Pseudonocardia nematodicida TaxID=1206997 RepID=A0ABV1KC98_9PSEU